MPVKGPWGGGNRTLESLERILKERGHKITFDINSDYDIIYCHDPKPDGNTGLRYEHLLHVKNTRNIPIIQRVGDVFYHRGEQYTQYLKETLKYSDIVTFISSWSAKFLDIEINNKTTFIHDLRPPSIFYRVKKVNKQSDKIRIFTHHWSNNSLKGLETYSFIDNIVGKKQYKDDFEFYYLGRVNKNFNPVNTTVIGPFDTEGVIDELDKADIYITASKFETGGNHLVEALARDIPVLYHSDGGGICSLCKEFGYVFHNNDELLKLIEDFKSKKLKIKKKFSGTLENNINKYIDLMEAMVIK